MEKLSLYCKAYTVSALRQFKDWKESLGAVRPAEVNEDGIARERTALADEDYLFLHDDFAVTDGIFRDEYIVFDTVTEDWISFCKETLRFEIPEDVRKMNEDTLTAAGS